MTRGEAATLAASWTGARVSDILHSPRGTPLTCWARALAVYLYWRTNGATYTETGRQFQRDRTTARHSVHRVLRGMDSSQYWQEKINGFFSPAGGV